MPRVPRNMTMTFYLFNIIMMKHSLQTLTLLCLLSLGWGTASAYDCVVDGIYYNLNSSSQTAEVTYKEQFAASYSGSVTIPTTIKSDGVTYRVTSIGNLAFYGCDGMTSVTIPNSVGSIGNLAFSFCSSLISVVSEVKIPFTFGNNAFSNISSTCQLTVPNGKRDAYIAQGWTTAVFQGGIVEAAKPKCATPEIISFINGKLNMTCATEGATCWTSFTPGQATPLSGTTVDAHDAFETLTVSVYATADGYEDSDVATATFPWANQTGDVNCDSHVNISDVTALVNIILGKTQPEPEPDPEPVAVLSCPDNHHPHLIDLGLPSGTLWACCNVGASKPEDYGGYYAWGETQTKSVYNNDTYQYYQDRSFVDIGSDISGTQYDAATANWGTPWRMPTEEDIQELLNNTTHTWTTKNGVNGREFRGANGGTFFLPASGDRWDTNVYDQGSRGYYWSGTLSPGYSAGAYVLYFSSDDLGWNDWYGRSYGRSVRPVSK